MNSHLWWYLARASGIVAWALLSASTVWGLLFSTRILKGQLTPKWLLALHRYLGGLALWLTGLHIVALMADSYAGFGLAELLIPLWSSWKPIPVAIGVISFYMLVAIELTSLAKKRFGRSKWYKVHLLAYPLFWLATIHGITAGTDAVHPLYWLANTLAAGTVVLLTFYRLLAKRAEKRPVMGSERVARLSDKRVNSEPVKATP